MAEETKYAEHALAHGVHDGKKKSGHAAGREAAKGKGAKKLKEMHIRKAQTGGFIARHEHEMPEKVDMERHPDEEHVLPDMEALKGHLEATYGGGEAKSEPGAEGGEGEGQEAEQEAEAE